MITRPSTPPDISKPAGLGGDLGICRLIFALIFDLLCHGQRGAYERPSVRTWTASKPMRKREPTVEAWRSRKRGDGWLFG